MNNCRLYDLVKDILEETRPPYSDADVELAASRLLADADARHLLHDRWNQYWFHDSSETSKLVGKVIMTAYKSSLAVPS